MEFSEVKITANKLCDAYLADNFDKVYASEVMGRKLSAADITAITKIADSYIRTKKEQREIYKEWRANR